MIWALMAVESRKNEEGEVMEVHELVIEMKLLERGMTLYEDKYGILSEDFYAALMAGELAEHDARDETRADFSRWKGIYETWKAQLTIGCAHKTAATSCFSKPAL